LVFLVFGVIVLLILLGIVYSKHEEQKDPATRFIRSARIRWDGNLGEVRNRQLIQAGIDSEPTRYSLLGRRWSELPGDVQTALIKSRIAAELTASSDPSLSDLQTDLIRGHEVPGSKKPPVAPVNTLDELAGEVGKRIAEQFSAKRFAELFRNKTLAANWTHNDALAIWYCLGYLCLLLSVNSAEVQESTGSVLLDSGLKGLLEVWEMPGSTYQRFASFNRAKLMPALSLYSSISNANEFRQFFGLFASEILGQDVAFSPGSLTVLAQLLQGNRPNYDISLHQTICSMFVATQNEVGDYIRKEAKAILGEQSPHEVPVPLLTVPEEDRMKKMWEAWNREGADGIGKMWEEEDPVNPPKTGTPQGKAPRPTQIP
jgi:hypothetical protein